MKILPALYSSSELVVEKIVDAETFAYLCTFPKLFKLKSVAVLFCLLFRPALRASIIRANIKKLSLVMRLWKKGKFLSK